MAYGYHPNQRRVLVPAPPPPPFYDPRVVGYHHPSSSSGFGFGYPNPNAYFGPVGFRVHPMEEQRNQLLIKFMEEEGLEPSVEEEMKRKDVIDKLKQIVLEWIKKVAWQRHFTKEVIAKTAATILPFGSYGLGVHGSDSDVDALCVGPYFATLEDDFFIVLRNMLQSRPEVSDVHCVKSAKVPLMRFRFSGISVDFPYAQLRTISISDDVDLFNPYLQIVDQTSWRSLSGVRANQRILQLVPNLKNFQAMLRCVKLWARRRGVYSHLLGFFGGIHLAILAAYTCQRYPDANISTLISVFFEEFSHWPWPRPVILQDKYIPFKHPDSRSLMPIMMPCSPYEWCNSNITKSTFNKINTEFQHGFLMIRELGRPGLDWSSLFEPFPYSQQYSCFVRIFLAAPNDSELGDWVGWVKSRFRSLLLKLEMVQGFCDPNPTEYVDPDCGEPNSVFYWGLSSSGGNFININSVKEDFMKSVSKDLYRDDKNNRCKLELSIVGCSELPKNLQDSGDSSSIKACWRIPDYNQLREEPLYSHHLPHYVVGYVPSDREHPNAIG